MFTLNRLISILEPTLQSLRVHNDMTHTGSLQARAGPPEAPLLFSAKLSSFKLTYLTNCTDIFPK